MDKADRDRKRAWKSSEREAARAAFPLADDALEDLFAHVSAAVDRSGCDHTLRATEAWLAKQKVDAELVKRWLAENGGYCDCEVDANAADQWQQNR
jgi:hypothetical protein